MCTLSPLHMKLQLSNLQRYKYAQRKDAGKQEKEEVTDEPKRFTMQEMARGFSLFEEALLVFQAQDPNVEPYMKIQCYCIIYDEKKRATTQRPRDHFFKRVDSIESSIRTRICAISIRGEWNCGLPSISYCWWWFSSTISPPLSPVSNSLARSLDTSPCIPAVVLYYCAFPRYYFYVLFVWIVL